MTGRRDRFDARRAPAAYDAFSIRYDDVTKRNRINAYMRARSLERLLQVFHPGMRLVELGCGTGEEARALAHRGIQVVATDPSEGMLEAARHKAEEAGVADRLDFVRLRAKEAGRLSDHPWAPFDGAYASFSLAYEEDLRPVVEGMHEVLRPGAAWLSSLPSRLCLVEWWLSLSMARPGLAGRRLREWYSHKVGATWAPIRSYTPESFARALRPSFRVDRLEALPLIVPPPYMNAVYARFPGLADTLEHADPILARRSPFRGLGDHFLAESRRLPG